jgi:hypothetical protein
MTVQRIVLVATAVLINLGFLISFLIRYGSFPE